MDYRQATPPSTSVHVEDYDFQCTGGSASTASFYPNDWSPASMMTAASTPPRSRSPSKAREMGPLLLPRVRAQDQYIGWGPDPSSFDHRRAISLNSNDFPMQFGGHLPTPHDSEKRSNYPASYSLVSLPSEPVAKQSAYIDLTAPHRPPVAHMRSRSTSNIHSHSRNSSSSSIDASMLNRYGYPTYRHSPTPQPMGASASTMATNAPVIAAVRVPPSAWITSQSIHRVLSPMADKSTTERSALPIRRWISIVRPLTFPRLDSRTVR